MKSFCTFILLIFNLLLYGQGNWQDNIKWKFSIEKIDSSHAYIVGKATLFNHYHIFSVNHDPKKADLTGTPTTFNIRPSKDFKLIGRLIDGSTPKKIYRRYR